MPLSLLRRGPCAALLLVQMLGACSLSGGGTGEGIGFREARFAEIAAARTWRACVDDALALDREARADAAPARYLASARLLEKCESDLNPGVKIAEEERLRAYAVAAQNALRGGDVAKARETLERLRKAFPGRDLYGPNGESFIDTLELLLGLKDRSAVGEFGTANVNETVKAELRRSRYWIRN
jgi:hypothetical protein